MIFKSRFKKILVECIANTFDVRMLNKVGQKIESQFDFNKITGISDKMSVQSMDAANILVEYFFNSDSQLKLISEIINANFYGVDGYKTPVYNISTLFEELIKLGFIYDKNLKKIILKDRDNALLNWGILDDGEEYSFCFVSIDIVESSKIVRKNRGVDITETYKSFHDLLKLKVDKRDGRVWMWEGDGGLIAFYGDKAINRAVFSILDFFFNMPFYNAVYNKLNNEIRYRAAIHPGTAVFRNQVNKIQSQAIDRVKELEKNHATPANLVISKLAMQSLNPALQSFFKPLDENSNIYILNCFFGRKLLNHER